MRLLDNLFIETNLILAEMNHHTYSGEDLKGLLHYGSPSPVKEAHKLNPGRVVENFWLRGPEEAWEAGLVGKAGSLAAVGKLHTQSRSSRQCYY